MPSASKRPQVSDPHPEDEVHYHDKPRPGGARPPRDSVQRVNPATHDGDAPPAPDYDHPGQRGK